MRLDSATVLGQLHSDLHNMFVPMCLQRKKVPLQQDPPGLDIDSVCGQAVGWCNHWHQTADKIPKDSADNLSVVGIYQKMARTVHRHLAK